MDLKMTNILRRFHIVIFVVLTVTVSAHGIAEPNSKAVASLMIHSAFVVDEGDDGFRRLARSKLGCDPCSEIVVRRADDQITYLYDKDSGIEIVKTMVSGSRIDAVDESFVLGVTLDEEGRALVASSTESILERAANFVGGEFVDIVLLKIVGSYYMIGAFDTIDDARAVAAKLGVTPIEGD